MRIIHINDKLTISGGVEVYISQIQRLLNDHMIESDWVAIKRLGKDVRIESENPNLFWEGPLIHLKDSPLVRQSTPGQTIFHVHSHSDPRILNVLFELSPLIRTIHEPRIFCPGQGKYWSKSERICELPMGLHCFAHAYTQHCCNRHPRRLLKQYWNSHYEVKEASGKYHKLLANSTYILDEAIKSGFAQDQLELLHYSTPETEMPEWSVTSNARVTYVGRLSRTKGVHFLLQAMAQVHSRLKAASLDIVGDGHDANTFLLLAKELAITDCVRFNGWGDRALVDKIITQSDLVVFPSIYPEAFGICGIEAMMRGKPVVGFDVGGVKDWLRHEETGLLVPVKDTQGFAGGIIRILSDDALRLQMGQRAREIALAEFSEEVHFQKLIQIYEQALEAR